MNQPLDVPVSLHLLQRELEHWLSINLAYKSLKLGEINTLYEIRYSRFRFILELL